MLLQAFLTSPPFSISFSAACGSFMAPTALITAAKLEHLFLATLQAGVQDAGLAHVSGGAYALLNDEQCWQLVVSFAHVIACT